MQKQWQITCWVLTLLAFSAGPALAGAWTQPAGASYNRLSVNYFFSDEYYIDDSDRLGFPNDGDFRDSYLNYYAEYGLNDRLTAIGSFNYKYLIKEDDTIKMENWGFGDADLALKYKIYQDVGVFAIQGLYKIFNFYDEDDQLPLGNGQADFELRLLFGKSLYPHIPGYCNVEAGYRWRDGEPSDEYRLLGEFGMDFTEQFYGRVKLDAVFGVDNDEGAINVEGNPTKTEVYDLVKLDIAAGCKLSGGWSIELAYTPTLYGQWTAAGATYTAAVVFEMNE